MQRIEAGTMKKLMERLREDDFLFYILSIKAITRTPVFWIFDKLENHVRLPLADAALTYIRRAPPEVQTQCARRSILAGQKGSDLRWLALSRPSLVVRFGSNRISSITVS
jgi:hypothetical protein